MFMQSFLHFLFLHCICTLGNNICSNWHAYLGIVGMTWIAHISCMGEVIAVELWCENFQ